MPEVRKFYAKFTQSTQIFVHQNFEWSRFSKSGVSNLRECGKNIIGGFSHF